MMRSLAAFLLGISSVAATAADWHTSYAKAFEISKSSDKPIFVYFTNSAQDAQWQSKFDGIEGLTEKFVLVVGDKNTPQGEKLFKTFEMNGSAGSVVIERERNWQYYRAERDLNREDLSKVLANCQDAKGRPSPIVTQNVSQTTIEQPATSVEPMPSTSYYQPSTFSSGSCPNCRRYR